ncbi:MAG: hypothetical protein U5L08_01570 [Xanthomonadales bacterium]|nr:hypothetical protein [Xanthomonadales bacterium]
MIKRYEPSAILIVLLSLAVNVAQAQPFVEGANHPRWDEAVQFASRWLDLADEERAEETMELMTPIFRANLSLRSWRTNLEAKSLEMGAV